MAAWAKLAGDLRLSLISHSCDVAATLEAILRHSPMLRRRLATAGNLDDLDDIQIARLTVLTFLHDFGKCNRGFQNKEFRKAKPKPFTAGHIREALVLLYDESCIERFIQLIWDGIDQWSESVLSIFLAVVSHHGDPIDLRRANSADAQLWDEKAYDDLRKLGVFMRENWSEAWSNDEAGRLPSNARFQHMFAGLVALADWLGSDTEFFPLDRVQYDSLYWSRQQAAIAVREIGLALGRVPPAAPKTFQEAFGITPRPLQSKAATMRLGHIMVLEDETGSGKTEAAMWIWRRLHDGGLVDGLYFALPTRSAATQIHRRIEKNLRLSLWGDDSAPACVLAVPGYIKADDQTGHRLLSTNGRPLPSRFMVQWDDNPAAAEQHRRWAAEWPLRYLAAYFAAGTIDQALLSGLKVNHSSMRASALARSLLLVDELHASDAYMGQILLRTIRHHVACGGYVLALSAILGSSLRSRLFRQDQPSFTKALKVPYPSVHIDGRIYKIKRGQRRKPIKITTVAPTDIIPLVLKALNEDAAVLVIRNTVNDAVDVSQMLERMGVNVVLHHSRYGVEDRKELDRRAELALAKNRPPGAVCVVGTQTLEQSLDIDADVLITDICPMDVLLQRMGRLHRHDRERSEAWREPHAFVLTPGDDLEPLIIGQRAQGLGPVYSDLRICQLTLEEIQRRGRFIVPDDCRELIELATHPDRLDQCSARSSVWQTHGEKMDGRGYRHQSIADKACIHRTDDWQSERLTSAWELDEEAATRLGVRDCRVRVDWQSALQPEPDQQLERVSAINVPGHWIFNIDFEAVRVTSEWEISAGTEVFRYSRFGFQRR